MSYGFKSSGRKTKADPTPCGEMLMPGMYNEKGFLDLQDGRKASYRFKDASRENKSAVHIGMQDKDITKSDLSPTNMPRTLSLTERHHLRKFSKFFIVLIYLFI